jgi:hypothetical protein
MRKLEGRVGRALAKEVNSVREGSSGKPVDRLTIIGNNE